VCIYDKWRQGWYIVFRPTFKSFGSATALQVISTGIVRTAQPASVSVSTERLVLRLLQLQNRASAMLTRNRHFKRIWFYNFTKSVYRTAAAHFIELHILKLGDLRDRPTADVLARSRQGLSDLNLAALYACVFDENAWPMYDPCMTMYLDHAWLWLSPDGVTVGLSKRKKHYFHYATDVRRRYDRSP